jgi:uncharacterized protein YggL (DUF469 family)
VLTDVARRQLQRLRFLLEEALSRAQDTTEIGRHSALVLLDGACEYALDLALGYLGLPIQWDFRKRFEDLRQVLDGWEPDTWASIIQLHVARNSAQHQGTVADASYIPSWSAQAQRFVDSLVEAAFGIELRTVLVAEAIETEDVRYFLVEAEKAIEQEDADTAFAAIVTGFAAARTAWEGQRAEAIGQLRLQATGLTHLTGVETDPINLALLRFEELLVVQPFAPDIAEYHWLAARQSEFEQKIAPSLDAARRALLFVIAWVLRWEAFAAGYEARRYPPTPPPYEPPITGADHPVIHDAEVETLHHVGDWLDDPTSETVRYSVKLALADIPVEERGLWAQQVGDVLNEIIAARGTDYAGGGSVDNRGIVRLHGVTARTTGDEIRQWLKDSLAEGDRRYRVKLSERQMLAARLPGLRESLEQALGDVASGQMVTEVSSEERDDGSTWLGVSFRIDDSNDPMLQHILQNSARSVIDGRSGVDFYHSTLWLELEHDALKGANLVAAIAAEFHERSSRRKRGLADVEEQRRALETDLLEGR